VLPCARCHKVGGEGGEAGPDLSLIGAQKSKEYLLESILKPSAHIAAGFDVVTFQLKNGATETGSLASETPTEIVLKRADNTTVTIDPKQVKERVTAPSSMPEIYAQVLTRSQLRDMVALLSVLTQSQRPDGDVPFGQSNRAMSSTAQETKAGGHP
jgi:putative heme-binding domain-containing protein